MKDYTTDHPPSCSDVLRQLHDTRTENEHLRMQLALSDQRIRHLEHRNATLEQANADLALRNIQHLLFRLQVARQVRHG